LSKITKNRSPSKFLRRRKRFSIVIIIVEIESVFERSNSIREIATEFMKLVLVVK
jgi:hypothetical protein